ncbi:MAG TPA: RHS repeat-associated core domain-containing protein [Methanobacteriaceae archaeon]|nr:RHS repeat-associated core domain-containing protein [Methanobacteriaceae archaeon]
MLASTDSSGALIANTDYSPYGVNLGLALSPFGFAGEWTDPDTKHSYLRARWLDTITGTFLSRDPMVQTTGDAYGYAAGNPINRIDPLGLYPVETSDKLNGNWWNDYIGINARKVVTATKGKAIATNPFMACLDWSTIGTAFGAAGTFAAIASITIAATPLITGIALVLGGISLGITAAGMIDECVMKGWAENCQWAQVGTALSWLPFKFSALGKFAQKKPNFHTSSALTRGKRLGNAQYAVNAQVGAAKFYYGGISVAALGQDLTKRFK